MKLALLALVILAIPAAPWAGGPVHAPPSPDAVGLSPPMVLPASTGGHAPTPLRDRSIPIEQKRTAILNGGEAGGLVEVGA